MNRFSITKRRVALLGILALSVALRGPGLFSRALDYEEALCWFYARIPLSVQWRRDIRGPLNYAPLAPAALLSPRPEFVRLVSFFVGTASSLLPFWLPGLPLRTQIGAATFLAFSPPLVRQSQGADGCAFGFLLEGLALLLAISYALHGGTWCALGHGLLSLLSLQIHVAFGWSLIGRMVLFSLWGRSRKARVLLLSGLPGTLGMALVLLLSRPPPLKGGIEKIAASVVLTLVEPSMGFVTSLRDFPQVQVLWLFGLVACFLSFSGGVMLWRKGLWGRVIIASGLSAALLFIFAVGVKGLPPLPRYLLPAIFPFAICFGVGFSGKRGGWLAVPVFAIQILGSLAYLSRPYYGVDWREAAKILEAEVGADEPVVLHPPAAGLMLRHYLHRPLDLRPRGIHWFTAKGFFVGPEGRDFRPNWGGETLRAAKEGTVWVVFWNLNPKGREPPDRVKDLKLVRQIRIKGYAESAMLARYSYSLEGLR